METVDSQNMLIGDLKLSVRAYNCLKQSKVTTVSQLLELTDDDLLSIRNLGKSTLEELKNIIKFLLAGSEIPFVKVDQQSETDNYLEIHDDFKYLPIDYVFPEDITRILKKQGIMILKGITTANIKDLKREKYIGIAKADRFFSMLKDFEQPFDSYVDLLFNRLKSMKEYDVFQKRVFQKMTLESIACLPEYEITRERVRQIEKNFKIDILKTILAIEEALYQKEELSYKETIEYQDLVEGLHSNENAMIMIAFIEEGFTNHLTKLKDSGMIFIDKKISFIEEKLSSIIQEVNNNSELIDYDDAIISIEEALLYEGIDYFKSEILEEYLRKLGYDRNNKIFTEHNLSKGSKAEYVLSKYFENGITCDKENIDQLKILVKSMFNTNEIENDAERTVWSTFADRKNKIIQWGRNTRIHLNHVIIDDDAIKLIHAKIDLLLEQSDFIASKELYSDLIEIINLKTNLPNEFALYGIIKHYFYDEYDLHHYTIKNKNRKTDSLIVSIEKAVINNDGRKTISELKEDFRCTDSMIGGAINIQHDLLLWNDGSEVIHSRTLNISENNKSLLSNAIENSFDKYGYTNTNIIMQLEEEIFNSLGVYDVISAYSLLKYLFQDTFYFYRRPTILKSVPNLPFKKENILLNVMKEKAIHNIVDLRKTLVRRYKLDEIFTYSLVNYAKNDIFQISQSEYCLMENISLDNSLVNKIQALIDEALTNTEYVNAEDIADKLKGVFINVCDEKIPLNGLVIKEIVIKQLNADYRIVTRKPADFRFDKAIIVRADSYFTTLGEVILHILRNEYHSNNWSIESIELYLRTKRVLASHLPEEFIKHIEVSMDKYGNINVRNERRGQI